MRTTIRLDDALLREAKATAARAGRSLNDFIADAVRLAVRSPVRSVSIPEIPVFQGGRGLRAGVSLDSNALLLDVMESGERAR
jgi:hypothetical protein